MSINSRIINIVRRHRRPLPQQVRGPMTEACKWLAGDWDRPMPGYWDIGEETDNWEWRQGERPPRRPPVLHPCHCGMMTGQCTCKN